MRRRGRLDRQRRALERLRCQAGIVLTPHAQHRARELGFHESDVLRCVIAPEQTYTSGPRYSPGRLTYQRLDCACIVDTTAAVVITVLLRRPQMWQHGVHTRDTTRSPFSATAAAS